MALRPQRTAMLDQSLHPQHAAETNLNEQQVQINQSNQSFTVTAQIKGGRVCYWQFEGQSNTLQNSILCGVHAHNYVCTLHSATTELQSVTAMHVCVCVCVRALDRQTNGWTDRRVGATTTTHEGYLPQPTQRRTPKCPLDDYARCGFGVSMSVRKKHTLTTTADESLQCHTHGVQPSYSSQRWSTLVASWMMKSTCGRAGEGAFAILHNEST